MSNLKVEILQGEGVQQFFQNIDNTLRKELKNICKENLKPVLEAVRNNSPYETGRTYKAWTIRKMKAKSEKLGIYGSYVASRTKKFPARDGKPFFYPAVLNNSKGSHLHHFVQKAVERVEDSVLNKTIKDIEKRIDSA